MAGIIFFWVIIGPIVGAAIGQTRNNAGMGAVLGLLFGPLGWLLALLDDKRRQCPECLGRVPKGARKCQHCGSAIAGPAATGYVEIQCPACGERGKIKSELAKGDVSCFVCNRVFPATAR